jgi:CO/xanthine dehydrogenase Mo-binding subunit
VAGAGCYGHNGADDAALDAATVSVEFAGRPVRVQWSRTNEPLGTGEAAQGPVAAAIGNAASRALGVRMRDLPLTRDRLVSLLTGS